LTLESRRAGLINEIAMRDGEALLRFTPDIAAEPRPLAKPPSLGEGSAFRGP